MAKKKTGNQIDFPFYTYLKYFYDTNKKLIFANYSTLSKKFLAFNNPENQSSWLREPQFEALEMYVFLKEFCDNQFLYEIFEEWFKKVGRFQGREEAGINMKTGVLSMFGPSEFTGNEKEIFEAVFTQIKSFKQIYPNYIFALTMGLGKTILMATSIYYEFLLANKYPQSLKYCHNALVFAPDKTVLHSLKEIETFDKSKVIPPEYVNWLNSNLKFHFLDDTGISLNALENSKFNIIISNTQKIILKKQHAKKSASESLFNDSSGLHKAKVLNKDFEDLYGFEINTDQDLLSNQRFAKLTRLKQLGIYVDEAHHVFGSQLASDFGIKKSATSLRVTINELAESLNAAGSKVIACYNYTGTPYVGSRLLPEVVYAYGLKDAIDNQYLKKVKISGFENIKNQAKGFVKTAISEFWSKHNGVRYEGMLPKFAFFASSIEELQEELRPIVEEVLVELNIPISKILVNVGDEKITSNDDLREFKNLDTTKSEKQFILLVNKGKEGWNCRSLFGVGLHREPKSKIFVLQATMRCLRAITSAQETGMVYLSAENVKTLEEELEENFKLSIDDLNSAGDKKDKVEVRLLPPPVRIKIQRIKKLFNIKEKILVNNIDFEIEKFDKEQYKIIRTERDIKNISRKLIPDKDVTSIKEQNIFTSFTLVGEIARYLNRSAIELTSIIESSKQGMSEIVNAVNEHNEFLYDWVIPRLFSALYDLREYESEETEEIELVKTPKDGFYLVHADREKIANIDDIKYANYKSKSFHLDNYCFDSNPELAMFWSLISNGKIEKVWFTGMLTHGQSDFLIRYIDPESHTVRSYYPDFLVKHKTEDGTDIYTIVEVKGDNKIDDAVVKAKAEYASQLAFASGMTYKMVKGSLAAQGID